MILGFKEQFKDKILSGAKIHTIRVDKKDRLKIGRILHFATGVRTKNYQQFDENVCRGIQPIKIEHGNTVSIKIDGRELSPNEVALLAYNDGFESVDDFLNWFDKDFEGKIVHWSDFIY